MEALGGNNDGNRMPPIGSQLAATAALPIPASRRNATGDSFRIQRTFKKLD